MPRETAWRVLRSGSPKLLAEVDRFAREAELEPRDRALVRRIVGTEVRRRGTLRAIVRRLAKGKPKPDLIAHLHVGLVQLFFLDSVPPHAAVSETVRAASNTLGLSKGRYVNAVLRAALRARREESSGDPRRDLIGREISFEDPPLFHDPEEHPLLWAEDALSIPANLMKRWVEHYGAERAEALARAAMDEPRLSLRAADVSRESLENELADLDVPLTRGEHPGVLIAPSGATEPLVSSAAFQEGRFTIQGETALRAAELVGAQPGERVLDLCAAPGGKTAVLAGSGAQVLALDRSGQRLARMRSGLERLRVPGRVHVVAMDGLTGLSEGTGPFDAALVDAPCSNTGVLAARPGARWRFGPAAQRELAALQSRLLDEAASRVRTGGRLVYSTCSLEPEENARQVKGFLERHSGWQLDEERESLPSASESGPVDGGYAARLLAP